MRRRSSTSTWSPTRCTRTSRRSTWPAGSCASSPSSAPTSCGARGRSSRWRRVGPPACWTPGRTAARRCARRFRRSRRSPEARVGYSRRLLDVATAVDQRGGDQEDRDPAEQDERRGGEGHVGVAAAGDARQRAADQVVRQAVVDEAGERLEDRHPDEDRDDGEDLIAHERAERDAERRREGRDDQAARDDRDVVRAGQVGPVLAREQRDAEDERDEPHDRGERERRQRVRGGAGEEKAQPVGGDEHGRRERAVAELAGRRDGAEQQQHERDRGAEVQRVALVRERRRMARQDRDQHTGEDEQQRRRGEAERRPRRADLDQLSGNQPAHGSPFSAGAGSEVRARKASSSDVARGLSSCSGTPAANAMSPTRAASTPSTTSAPSGVSAAVRPSRYSAERSSSGRGERTSTPAPAAVRVSTGPCSTSRPRWITTTSSTVWATSASTWLETSTVRPSRAMLRRKSRSQRMPWGSSPLAGSSRMSTRGSPSSVAARPSRWRIPSEYLPARRSAAWSSSTRRSTSSTRELGRPAMAASARRWLRPERPGCAPATSRLAPTVRAGSSRST